MQRIYKIVLTGGPCAGKTTVLPFLVSLLKSKGWKVFTIPETATLLSNNGISLVSPTLEERLATQSSILALQMTLEEAMVQAAKSSGKDSVIICDRGIMDAKAYTPHDVWPTYLSDHNWSEMGLREGRYDAVFHMVSAAVGAKEFYNNDNPARFENVEMAGPADRRTQESWVGHPHLRIIDNSTNFPTKIARLCDSVESFLAADHKEIERRFLIGGSVNDIRAMLPEHTVEVTVTQRYLKANDDSVARVRCRYAGITRGSEPIFTYTTKSKKTGTSCTEIESKISLGEYNQLVDTASDPNRLEIWKRRHHFLYENRQFELDEYVNPHTGLMILEVELDNENEKVVLPHWMPVVEEITGKPEYSNWNLAKYERANSVASGQ